MSEPILFYFDFSSPYGYLGSVGIERLAAERGRLVQWRPILLGVSVVKVMGLKALADTPLKRDYVRHDVERCALVLGIPFRRASLAPMRPLAAARAFVWLDEQDPAVAKRFGQTIYRAQWAEARDMSSADAVVAAGTSIGLDADALRAAIGDERSKVRLRARVDAAIGAGVFGVPSFVVAGEMFWGADRLPMLEAWLQRADETIDG